MLWCLDHGEAPAGELRRAEKLAADRLPLWKAVTRTRFETADPWSPRICFVTA